MQQGFSFSQLIRRAARVNPHGAAVLCGGEVRTWPGTLEDVRRLAGVLVRHGVRGGDRVAMLAHNCPLYLTYFFAVPWAGGVAVPVNTRLAPAEMIYWLEDSGSRVLLVDEHFAGLVPELRAAVPALETVLYTGTGDAPQGTVSLRAELEDVAPADDAGRGGNDLFALFYTGGTTGRSKGVMLTHGGLILNTMQWSLCLGMNADERLLIVAPLFHLVGGLNCLAGALLGASVSILPRFEPRAVLADIERSRVTKAAMVPTMIHALLADPDIDRFDLSSLRKISYGGSPMPESLLRRALERLPHTEFTQIYGQTEAGPNVAALAPKYHGVGPDAGERMLSAGQPLPGVELEIRGPAGEPLEAGEIGEICVRSPAVSPGYWNLPDATRETFRGGWVRTGDAGRFDADGFLYIVDRVKDMIITGGENVYSAEVERVLASHPAVEECAVIGIPNETWGEQVHAIVRLRRGRQVAESDLLTHCRHFLAGYKCVRSIEFRSEPFPLSGANKILKRELRAPYWARRTRSV